MGCGFRRLLGSLTLLSPVVSPACDSEYRVQLNAFGNQVLVELRSGAPGASRVVQAKRSSGGAVMFSGLCPGPYFLAIGDDKSVSVTPTHQIAPSSVMTSTITLQRGSGNVRTRDRSSL